MLPTDRFLDFCARHKLLQPGQRVLAAVSGGKDSVMLVHLLSAAQLNFGIAHVNFQLRGDESLRDENFVKKLAADFNVPFYLTHFNTKEQAAEKGISTQMAARELRYTWFEKLCAENGFDVVAVAHHQNDVAETMLLNLVRGTGIAGLHGISPKNGHIIRPMLFLNREEIDEWISAHKISYVEDSSNASADYARNKIRLEVLPKLRELNPSLERTFESNARRFLQTEEVLQSAVLSLQKKLLRKDADGFWLMDKARFSNLKPLQLLAFELLKPFGFTEPVVGDIIRSLSSQPGRQFLSGQNKLTIDRENLIIEPLENRPPKPVRLCEVDEEIRYAHFTLKKTLAEQVGLSNRKIAADPQKLIYPLTIRPWQNGDYFYPVGIKGKKKLSDEFTDRKIPLAKKPHVPVLVNGNGEIIWICGIRPDRRFTPEARTGKVVIFELCEHIL